MDTQLAIIGGGPAGYTAAFLAADLGMSVTLVDREPHLGGVCLLRGCIPSKALLHVAKAKSEAARLADWGVTFGAANLDLDAMRARKQRVIQTLTAGLKQLSVRRKVRVVRARATFEDSHTLHLEPAGSEPPEDDRLRFEHCILATGSEPAKIPLLDLPTDRVMNSTAALELPEVPESMLVVGGGYIGLEMGTIYAALGSRVSVVEMTGGLLPGVDRNLVKPLYKKLQSDFETIYLNTKVAAMADRNGAIEVVLEGDAKDGPRQFSRVLVAVGRRPNSADLRLEKTRVEVDERGVVVVNPRRRTADPHILAIGDVSGEPMLAHKAAHEGKVAVKALVGQPAEFAPRAIPAVVFTDPEIAWAGLTETEAKAQNRDVDVAQFPWAASGRARAVGRTDGTTKWLIDRASGRVVGCGIVGPGAGELIGEAVVAIEMGAAPRDLANAIHPHPTLSETLSSAADVHLGTATDLYRPKRI